MGVRVGWGTGRGSPGIPQGYPLQSLPVVVGQARYILTYNCRSILMYSEPVITGITCLPTWPQPHHWYSQWENPIVAAHHNGCQPCPVWNTIKFQISSSKYSHQVIFCLPKLLNNSLIITKPFFYYISQPFSYKKLLLHSQLKKTMTFATEMKLLIPAVTVNKKFENRKLAVEVWYWCDGLGPSLTVVGINCW